MVEPQFFIHIIKKCKSNAFLPNIIIIVNKAKYSTRPLSIAMVGLCMESATKSNIGKAILDIIRNPDKLD